MGVKRKTAAKKPLRRRHVLRTLEHRLRTPHYLTRVHDVLGYAVGFRERRGKKTEEPVLVVYVRKGRKQKQPRDFPRHQRIPRKVKIKVRNRVISVGTDLVESKVGKLCGPATIAPGLSVGNRDSRKDTGTVGWIARTRGPEGQLVFCSSFHVLLPSSYNGPEKEKVYTRDETHAQFVTVPSVEDGGDINNDIVGEVLMGMRSYLVDVADVLVFNPKSLRRDIPGIGRVGPARILQAEELDPNNPIHVKMRGRTSSVLDGVIKEYPSQHEFRYPDGVLPMYDLIVTDLPTGDGDSGAVLLDDQRRPLGILLGNADRRSFFVHIRNIMTTMRLTDANSDNTAKRRLP